MNQHIEVENQDAQIQNIFTDEAMETIEELANEYGIETEWTNDGKPYLTLCGQKDTEIYIPVDSDDNRMHMIFADSMSEYNIYAVSTWTYEEADYSGEIPELSPNTSTSDEQYSSFADAVEELEYRLKKEYGLNSLF